MEKNKGLFMKYFVLNPYKDDAYGRASRAAIREYAAYIEHENKVLSDELDHWVNQIEEEL
jgi:hypothetical protein